MVHTPARRLESLAQGTLLGSALFWAMVRLAELSTDAPLFRYQSF